jgi:hypothetical protein
MKLDRFAQLGILLDFERSRRARAPLPPQKAQPAARPTVRHSPPPTRVQRVPVRASSALEQQEQRDAARGATSPLGGRAK